MSHQVTVDYGALSIEIQAQCDTAVHSLCSIDKTLNRIHETANKLENSKVKEYEKYLLDSKAIIQEKIEVFKSSLEQYNGLKKTGEYSVEAEYKRVSNELRKQSEELTELVNSLTGSKLAVIDQMINDGLLDAKNELVRKMEQKLSFNETILAKINLIEDISLRELAYRELLKEENKSLEFEQILNRAQTEYDSLLGKKTKEVIEEYKEDLKKNGVNSSKLDNVTSIDEANRITNESIVDEKVRLETLKVIIKSIKDRGFIVDTKNNLKIDREKNIVKLVAKKASGQTAEFEIQLNGKFMYHFDGYEGLACKKDITPFLDDLKNIYGINILHEEVQWSNPDKIQTQKYQYINKNKGTN